MECTLQLSPLVLNKLRYTYCGAILHKCVACIKILLKFGDPCSNVLILLHPAEHIPYMKFVGEGFKTDCFCARVFITRILPEKLSPF